jgi:hypothetical protein
MLVGVDRKNWGSYRKNYHKPGHMESYLTVSRLDGQNLADAIDYSDLTLRQYKNSLNQISEDRFHLSTQYQTVPLIRTALNLERKHNRVIDIGVSYGRVDRLLAEEYPSVNWDLVDFPTTLKQENQDIKLDNMEFHSGYPLEFLEKTENQYDVAIFNRTLALMGRSQIAEYLKVLKNKTRYIVFGEPCRIDYEPGNLDIDWLHPDYPRCYGQYLVHNYRAVLEAAGYRLLHYDAQRGGSVNSTPLHFLIRGVAEPID